MPLFDSWMLSIFLKIVKEKRIFVGSEYFACRGLQAVTLCYGLTSCFIYPFQNIHLLRKSIYLYIYSYNLNNLKPLAHTVNGLLRGTAAGNRTYQDVRKLENHHYSQTVSARMGTAVYRLIGSFKYFLMPSIFCM